MRALFFSKYKGHNVKIQETKRLKEEKKENKSLHDVSFDPLTQIIS